MKQSTKVFEDVRSVTLYWYRKVRIFEKSYFHDEKKFVLQDDFRPFFVYRKVFEQHKVCGYNKVLIYYFQTIFQ